MIQRPIRKTRSKTRKPKFLSLRLKISSFENPQIMTQKQQQLNLFPLHPENHVEDRDENMAFIFNNDVNNTCCCLQSFLSNNNNNNNNNNNTISVSSEDDTGVGVGRCEEDADSLVRTAMRSRERSEGVEEKWVCYSEVVEKKGVSESVEVSSSAAADEGLKKKQNRRQLSLKLDYQGILKAWSDKAPLYIKHEFPQTVPSLYDDHNLIQSDSSFADRLIDGWGTDGNVWKVPEMGEKKEDLEAKEGCKMAQREASVLRYKEKRQSRLFSKRIRYEVRKLNAEKRPRMKGRFVKRN